MYARNKQVAVKYSRIVNINSVYTPAVIFKGYSLIFSKTTNVFGIFFSYIILIHYKTTFLTISDQMFCKYIIFRMTLLYR